MYQAPRGTFDILPREQGYWSYIKQKAVAISELYGYQRIDTPTFEDARLFARSIGEETDIVEKEMYTLEDRSGDKLTLRPEGTASVCRAYVEHGMHTLPQPVRLYYMAAIFRYERPQAGRYRQHHQFGVEALGDSNPALDAEVIDIAWQFYVNLGLHGLSLYLNSIGCNSCRPAYLDSLRAYYSQHRESLCPDCRRRLLRNPLRLLDCKRPSCIPLTEQAPRSIDYLCDECAQHFDQLERYLNLLNLPFVINHRLVRGFDYYTKTVFEIAPEGEMVAQATIGAGGRYDDLIAQLGGRPTPAIGFATGIERLVLNLKKQKVAVPVPPAPAVFIAYLGQEAKDEALKLAFLLRKSGHGVTLTFGDRSLKAQLKQANSTGTRYAVIIGEDEVRGGTVLLRDMGKGKQETIPLDKVAEALS
ncbi:MAG: histidine--tRNA ligase [Dehalococcoidia bacterium]|nr:MAG: histidine--tRNA ligase [Dehalococcoidia bacterium]